MRVVYERPPLRYQIEVLEPGTVLVADAWVNTGYAYADLEDAKEQANSEMFAHHTIRIIDTETDDD